MHIDPAPVGARYGTDTAGNLQITSGLYLPGISPADGFGVVLRIIHAADRFDPAVLPVDVAVQ